MPTSKILPAKRIIFPTLSKKKREIMNCKKIETKRRLFAEHQAALKK